MATTSVKDVRLFINFASKELGLTSTPHVHLVGAEENNRATFGHFLGTRKGTSITVRMTDRHPIDVMRTIAHELIHYKQRTTGMRSSEMMKEDQANALAGRIMRKFDTTYPRVFKDKPVSSIREDMGVAAMGGAVNNEGDHNIAGFDPLLIPKKQKVLKRKNPVEESNVITQTLGQNVHARSTFNKNRPKNLRDIMKREKSNEHRQETRTS